MLICQCANREKTQREGFCNVGAAKEGGYFQYTYIDEFSRYRILKAYKEHSTYTSAQFIKYVVEKFLYNGIKNK